MNRLIIVSWAFAIILQITNGATVSKEQFELREGDCNRISMGDLIFRDHVHLTRLPFVTRTATASCHGHLKIYCILALSEKGQSKGSTVSIKEGGVNETHVSLEFNSKKNHGLEYRVQIFGRE